MTSWTSENIPDQQGRTVVITGANSGLGLATTRALAAKGAHVVMGSRNMEKGKQAYEQIKAEQPGADIELQQLDLASLASVYSFAQRFNDSHSRLDLLFNNAGVMAIPRRETADGFEMQFGTNYLSHFALTGLLLPTLLATPQSRIVSTTSIARHMGRLNFRDLQRRQSYSRWGAYGQSKRADLLFAQELQHRLSEQGGSTISVAAHPGLSTTNLQVVSVTDSNTPLEEGFYRIIMPLIGQSGEMGALPQLYAATSLDIHGGELVGPNGLLKTRGYPVIERNSQKEYKRQDARRLWDFSEQLTGVSYLS